MNLVLLIEVVEHVLTVMEIGTYTCSHSGATGPHYYDATCYRCNSDGEVKTSCIHGQTSSHRYCTHYNNTTLTSHKYCSHGYTSEHA